MRDLAAPNAHRGDSPPERCRRARRGDARMRSAWARGCSRTPARTPQQLAERWLSRWRTRSALAREYAPAGQTRSGTPRRRRSARGRTGRWRARRGLAAFRLATTHRFQSGVLSRKTCGAPMRVPWRATKRRSDAVQGAATLPCGERTAAEDRAGPWSRVARKRRCGGTASGDRAPPARRRQARQDRAFRTAYTRRAAPTLRFSVDQPLGWAQSRTRSADEACTAARARRDVDALSSGA